MNRILAIDQEVERYEVAVRNIEANKRKKRVSDSWWAWTIRGVIWTLTILAIGVSLIASGGTSAAPISAAAGTTVAAATTTAAASEAGAAAGILSFIASDAFQFGLGVTEAVFDSTTSIVDGDNVASSLAWNFLPLGVGVIGSAVGKGFAKARKALMENFLKIGIVSDITKSGTIVIKGLAPGVKGYGKNLLKIEKVLGKDLTTKLKAGQLLTMKDINGVLDVVEKQAKKWVEGGLSETSLRRVLGKADANRIYKFYKQQPRIIENIKKEVNRTKVLQRFIEQRKGALYYAKESGYTIRDIGPYKAKLAKIKAVKSKYANVKNAQLRKLLIDAELNQYRAMKKVVNGVKKLLEAPKNLINVANNRIRKKLVRSVVDKNYRKLPASPRLRAALDLEPLTKSQIAKSRARLIFEEDFKMPKWMSKRQQEFIENAAFNKSEILNTAYKSTYDITLKSKATLERQLEGTIRQLGWSTYLANRKQILYALQNQLPITERISKNMGKFALSKSLAPITTETFHIMNQYTEEMVKNLGLVSVWSSWILGWRITKRVQLDNKKFGRVNKFYEETEGFPKTNLQEAHKWRTKVNDGLLRSYNEDFTYKRILEKNSKPSKVAPTFFILTSMGEVQTVNKFEWVEFYFRPEATFHFGEKGATPEPIGKRMATVKMDELQLQTLRDLTDNGGSVGQYFLKKLRKKWKAMPTQYQRNDKWDNDFKTPFSKDQVNQLNAQREESKKQLQATLDGKGKEMDSTTFWTKWMLSYLKPVKEVLYWKTAAQTAYDKTLQFAEGKLFERMFNPQKLARHAFKNISRDMLGTQGSLGVFVSKLSNATVGQYARKGKINYAQGFTQIATNYAFGKKRFTRYGKEMRNTIKRVPKITTFTRNRSSKLR
jgi:hypothetical protein